MLEKLKNRKGFTLIELVLVLAIAALIILIIFLAFQGAARGRRDNERRNAAARLLAAAETYASNNNGAYPPQSAAGCTNISDSGYNAGGYTCVPGSAPSEGQIGYVAGTDCVLPTPNASTRYIKAYANLEGSTQNYCEDNN